MLAYEKDSPPREKTHRVFARGAPSRGQPAVTSREETKKGILSRGRRKKPDTRGKARRPRYPSRGRYPPAGTRQWQRTKGTCGERWRVLSERTGVCTTWMSIPSSYRRSVGTVKEPMPRCARGSYRRQR